MNRALGITSIVTIGAILGLHAQVAPPAPRLVDVNGRPMRVWTAGIEQRKDGQPAVILEAGAGEGLDNWKPAFAQIAAIAPVVAYDRRGLGQSAPDTERQTLRRVAQSLHALLRTINVQPPYVLVGHSWGGLLTRAYIDQYAGEVTGLILLDALNPGLKREEQAKLVPPEERAAVLAPPTMPPIPPNTPPGLRAEMDLITAEMVNDYPEARSLSEPSGIPIVVVSAMPPNRLKSRGNRGFGIEPWEQAGLALRSPKGMFVVASHVGHMVHRDDPALVVQLIQHVIKNAGAGK
jgi:pimeloyl-ACP methyl ester carboxylesterase